MPRNGGVACHDTRYGTMECLSLITLWHRWQAGALPASQFSVGGLVVA